MREYDMYVRVTGLYFLSHNCHRGVHEPVCAHPHSTGVLNLNNYSFVFHSGNKMYSANAGDSRAVLAQFIDGKYVNLDLSKDQKPEVSLALI
jgi:hypothetical protein